MEEQTIELLKECNAGCKMGISSMEHVKEYVTDERLLKLIEQYKEKNKKLEEESAGLLGSYGRTEKEPGKMASAYAWASTEMKLALNEDDRQVAKIMMDGCNMAIQSVSEYINRYSGASKESAAIAKKILKVEEDFMKNLEQFR